MRSITALTENISHPNHIIKLPQSTVLHNTINCPCHVLHLPPHITHFSLIISPKASTLTCCLGSVSVALTWFLPGEINLLLGVVLETLGEDPLLILGSADSGVCKPDDLLRLAPLEIGVLSPILYLLFPAQVNMKQKKTNCTAGFCCWETWRLTERTLACLFLSTCMHACQKPKDVNDQILHQ